ncbi:DNA methyltransferase [Spiroplasma citri]|uniref:Site-specific DNA-methyltransferase n=1 Tax=Spiroplasma citri TaxID=2133 RepID=A0AAX3SVW8_SPICI|nr:DNA methyltransferase [Spiroplasma citri]APE74856.1 Putative methylase [Spiroplasma citri]WFG95462.1 site-specific DNA-methyltransferase [Spiroplasma citri]WFG99352.1 site-specific DNA-methyltransferase [Spiroplasma citri]
MKKERENHKLIIHPTQKPTELTEKLIFSRINGNNGRTLIPFAGSGSECTVAEINNIEYLGIELNPEYENDLKSFHSLFKGRRCEAW